MPTGAWCAPRSAQIADVLGMAQKRKKAGKTTGADRGTRSMTGGAQAFPAAQQRPTEPARRLTWRELCHVPPRKHMAFLIATAVALAFWMTFLLAMAVYW
jgi:hypothetical protein